MRVLGFHIEPNIAACSDGSVIAYANEPMNYLHFLLEPKENTLKVFRHLNYSTYQLIKTLDMPVEAGKILWQNHEVFDTDKNFGLSHVPGKYTSIKLGLGMGRPFANFADMSQYEEVELDDKPKDEAYCIAQAQEAARIGTQALAAFGELGVDAQTLTSPIRAYERAVLRHMDIPTVDDLDRASEEIGEMAYSACLGGWVEAFQRGYWPKAYNTDINSAYGFQLANLPDIRKGTWVTGHSKPYDSILGVVQARADITADFSPITLARENVVAMEEGEYAESESFTPKGRFDCILTQSQANFVELYRLGSVEVERGWWFVPKGLADFPYRKVAMDMYAKRATASPMAKAICKRILSGLYGYQRQLIRNEAGAYFMPLYAAIVETEASLQVARTAIESRIMPLHVAVDSIISDRPLPDSYVGDGLGQWKLKDTGPCIVVSSGMVAMSEKSNSDFSLSYSKLSSMIEKAPDAESYVQKKLGFVTLGMALNQGRWQDLGRMEMFSRTISIDSEAKRHYPESPLTGAELVARQYVSEPWDAEILETLTV